MESVHIDGHREVQVKITDQNAIKNGEKELIDTITGDLDWGAIEKLFFKKYNIKLRDGIDYKEGDMVIHDNQIAYRLNFEVKVGFTVLFDRKGECLDVTALSDLSETLDEIPAGHAPDEERIDPAAGEAVNENVSQMASQIADMISDINKD